mmetsp:Transcript_18384/g.55444  ORF Transcript_18384/g.55444 Transcript_18384/m.55444 type:complete len:225 (-) Transcript_18384:1234-1908(-)
MDNAGRQGWRSSPLASCPQSDTNRSSSGWSLANVPRGSSAETSDRASPSLTPRARMIQRGTITTPSGAENSSTPTCRPLPRRSPSGTPPDSEGTKGVSLKSMGWGIPDSPTRAIISCNVDGGSKTLSPSLNAAWSMASDDRHCNLPFHAPVNDRRLPSLPGAPSTSPDMACAWAADSAARDASLPSKPPDKEGLNSPSAPIPGGASPREIANAAASMGSSSSST